jgi:hypothetical protein
LHFLDQLHPAADKSVIEAGCSVAPWQKGDTLYNCCHGWMGGGDIVGDDLI